MIVHTRLIVRNLAALWNGVWRRLLPHLDIDALRLARECGSTALLESYNHLATQPNWQRLAKQSRLLTAAVLASKGRPAPLKTLYKRFGIKTDAGKLWARRQRLLPVFGVRRDQRRDVRQWIIETEAVFVKGTITVEHINKLQHIKQWRDYNHSRPRQSLPGVW